MSFQAGLSGLNSATKSLDVIGNNIANAQTVGMKASRAEFSSLVSSALGAGDTAGAGIGVAVSTVSQEFSQGNINVTGNNLDVAINGNGFFQLQLPDKSLAYSRNGQFKLDNVGKIVTNEGANVLGFQIDPATGAPTSVTPSPLVVPTGAPLPAKVTSTITAEFNLPAKAAAATNTIPPTAIETYGTSINAYDSQGVVVPVNLYFVKTGPDPQASPPIQEDTWEVFDESSKTAGTTALAANAQTSADNKAALGATPPGSTRAYQATGCMFKIVFDGSGKFSKYLDASGAPIIGHGGAIQLQSPNSAIGSFDVNLSIGKATQYGTSFSVTDLRQDGYTAGDLTGITIGDDGKVTTSYSNGQTQVNSQISMVDFRNVQGLKPIGAGNWAETDKSGQPIQGSPGTGKFGKLRSGALEESNVDLTAELVNMMTAQRSYQANVQTIKTQDQALQSLVNLR